MTSVKNRRDDSFRAKRPVDAARLHLADSGWERLFDDAMAAAGERLRIVCPFIKRGTIERLLNRHTPETIEVLTRFDLRHFCDEVSDVEAMALLLGKGARIRGVRNLHAKVYLFGSARAIVTSANLTRAALRSNHEFGFVSDDPSVLTRCQHYFDRLWAKAAPDLTSDRVAEWHAIVARHRIRSPKLTPDGLTDEGVDVGLPEEDVPARSARETASRSFVKFFGASDERVDRSSRVRDTVDDTGCHWACTYPKGRRPRQVEDGSVMFMARLVSHNDDIIIFGRALARSHHPERDDASASDIRRRGWKKSWPHYVRVYDPEFLDGDLRDGVSLYEMMDALEENSFVSTQRNAKAGHGNTNPRAAYRRHPHVELSSQGHRWVSDRLEAAFAKHGRLPNAVLASID